MQLALRRAVLVFLFLVTVRATAEEPWDAPAFSTEPGALLAAAEKVAAGEQGVVLLLDEAVYSFQADGSTRTTYRLMYRIASEAAVGPSAQVEANWAPWYDEKPVIAARVVTRNGTVHLLDANAVTEAPARDASLDIFSDNRILRAPLPAVEVGAIIEYTITVAGHSPIAGAGTSGMFAMARPVPVERTRLVLDAPASLEPRIVNRTAMRPTVEEKDGRRRTTFVSNRIEPDEKIEFYLPFDEAAYPYIAFSTGKSWQEIATEYAKIVDRQIAAGGELQKLVRSAIGNAKERREIVARALAAIQKDVRYAGVEVGEASIVPRTPATVLKNKYGDCKDKATLLVAMLRAAGLSAHVALLRAGSDLDVHGDLPGLGLFNHAIVRVDGGEPIWVDPTDEFARAGELPAEDQGRMALVASPSTTALTRTPEAPASANRYSEIRTFRLPEDGKAHVVEITETTGVDESYQRRYYVSSQESRYREGMEEYVKSYYLAKSLEKMEITDPHDLTKPFRLTLEATESRNAIVRDGEGAVAMHPAALFAVLPAVLRDWREPQPDDDPKDLPKKRVHDFLFPAPRVKVWTYRIIPPAGYVARTLPKNETRKLGSVTYTTEFKTEADGTVVATMLLDSGKRRLTAAEFEETRVAIGKLLREPQIDIGFDLVGQAKLNGGDVAGALAEFRKLVAMHPQEAQHHIEIARALLAGGVGEAARAEARKAVAIEPTNARAHLMLAQVLMHDLLGRPFRSGVDVAGALAALRKAKELDAENMEVRVQLARLLTRGSDGVQFGGNAPLAEAIDEYQALRRDLGDGAEAFDGELMLALAHAERFDELNDLANRTSDKQRRALGRILAVAATEGKDAALRELGSFDLDTRRSHAANLSQYLIAIRRYPEAAAMLDLSVQGTPKASGSALFADSVRKTRRIEDVKAAEGDPADLVRQLFLAVKKGDRDAALALMPSDVRDHEKKKNLENAPPDPFTVFTNEARSDDLSPASVIDMMFSALTILKDGSDETGYRLRLRAAEVTETDYAVFVTREDGRYVMRASLGDTVGLAALRFVGMGKVDVARQWLNWAREAVNAGGDDDPYIGSAFARLWPKAKAEATADEVRLAALVFVAEQTGETVETLEALRETIENDETRTLVDRALASGYGVTRNWAKLATVARRLAEKRPDSGTAFYSLATALAFAGKTAEAEAIAKQRLARIPNDRDALRALSTTAAAAGDFGAAEKYAQQIVDAVKPERGDYNNAAWYGLFAGNLERAMDNAHKATTGGRGRESAAALHTLAAVCAEVGKTIEAREALLSSMDQRRRDQPESMDWYVLGRIAEVYGVRDAALAAYKRVEKEDEPGGTVWQLTTRRLGQLK